MIIQSPQLKLKLKNERTIIGTLILAAKEKKFKEKEGRNFVAIWRKRTSQMQGGRRHRVFHGNYAGLLDRKLWPIQRPSPLASTLTNFTGSTIIGQAADRVE